MRVFFRSRTLPERLPMMVLILPFSAIELPKIAAALPIAAIICRARQFFAVIGNFIADSGNRCRKIFLRASRGKTKNRGLEFRIQKNINPLEGRNETRRCCSCTWEQSSKGARNGPHANHCSKRRRQKPHGARKGKSKNHHCDLELS